MCGINGVVKLKKEIDRNTIQDMNNLLKHRGPDDEGTFVFNGDNYSVGLGHMRLSILDLSANGHQPMGVRSQYDRQSELIVSDSRLGEADFVIVFNGEIYNYQDVKSELAGLGWNFDSNTDTEVLLKGYIEWGVEVLKKINGMWAFGIYDRKENKLILCRDRLGVKPLFYSCSQKNNFYFSSEIHPIKDIRKGEQEIDETAVYDFVTYGYIPAPKTFYKDICKLEAGSFLELNCLTCDFVIKKYWELDFSEKNRVDYIELNKIFLDSIEKRLISDVPVTILLSGGLDSQSIYSALCEMGHKIRGINLRFDDSDGDYKAVKKMVKENGGLVDFLKEDILSAEVEKIIKIFGEPFGDNSSVPTFLVTKSAKSLGHKVLISGDGGDELFFGYKKYRALFFLRFINIIIPLFLRRFSFGRLWVFLTEKNIFHHNIRKFILLLSLSAKEQYLKLSGGYVETEKRFIFSKDFLDRFADYEPHWHLNGVFDNNLSFVKRIQKAELGSYLPNMILTKVDRVSMINSVEVRSPFLDYRLFEYVSRVRSRDIFFCFRLKGILKRLMKNRLPGYILKKSKTGFGWRGGVNVNHLGNGYFVQNKKFYHDLVFNYYIGRR